MDSTRRDHRSFFKTEELYQQFRRILFVEKYIMLPIKTVIVLFALFFVRILIDQEAFDEALFLKYQILLYILGNLTFIYSIIKIGQRRFRINVVQVSAFFLSIMDCLFLSVLVYLTEGVKSPLYWAYIGLIMRNAVNFPKIQVQGVINVASCIFYIGAVILAGGPSG
ncbi:MAG: hypothetical protein P9M03_08185, partial [Candidatus Theseobacter exili]|nr:hypothetical protein [Candidatus Theseobacter exili]